MKKRKRRPTHIFVWTKRVNRYGKEIDRQAVAIVPGPTREEAEVILEQVRLDRWFEQWEKDTG